MIDNVGVDLDAEKIFDNDFEYLVVIGAMKKISEARMFQKMVLKETGIRTYVMQNHHQSWFFVYTDIVQSNKEAREKIELLEEKNILRIIIGNPWVYKLPKKR
jgi:hypothetical protein